MSTNDNRPLAGIKVADFSWFGAGPICAPSWTLVFHFVIVPISAC